MFIITASGVVRETGEVLDPHAPAPEDLCKWLGASCDGRSLVEVTLQHLQPPLSKKAVPAKPARLGWEIVQGPWDLVQALD
tara:strand:- start:991 stop:1233 length:243 start_codon:yes stop_codon:yes gene_type:complete